MSRLLLLPEPTPGDVVALQQTAEAGCPAAQAVLAEFSLFGRAGVARQPAEAIERLKALAARGEPHALVLLGDARRRGHWFMPRDRDAARVCYRRAAEAGSLEAEALLHVVDYEENVDTPGILADLRALAERRSARALVTLAHAARDGTSGAARDHAEAARLYRAAAEAGDPLGALNLYEMIEEGLSVELEAGAGHAFLLRAADRGCAQASYSLALHLLDRDSPAYDRTEGLRRLAQASDIGHVPALKLMGAAHLTGQPGVVDPAAAERCFRRAHELGHATAVEGLVASLIQLRRYGEAVDLARAALGSGEAADRLGDLRVRLGLLLELGLGAPPDPAEAARLYREALPLRSDEAGLALAMLAADGRVEGEPAPEALLPDASVLKRISGLLWMRAGPEALARLGRGVAALVARLGHDLEPAQAEAFYRMLAHGQATPEEQARLCEIARLGRARGSTALGTSLGWHLAYGVGCPEDVRAALPILRWAARKGDGVALKILGDLHTDGHGVLPSRRKAVSYYKRAGEAGVKEVWFSLGHIFSSGWGVRRDPAEALRWYERAIADGDRDAMVNAALLLSVGRNGPHDQARALVLLHRAAELGQPDAPAQIGYMHLKGLGVPKDATEAARWYRRAAEAGHPNGLMALGILHRTGRGVPRDRALALDLVRRSADQGYQPAVRALREWTAREAARKAA